MSPYSFEHPVKSNRKNWVRVRPRRLPLIIDFSRERVSTLFAKRNLYLVISFVIINEIQPLDFLFQLFIPWFACCISK